MLGGGTPAEVQKNPTPAEKPDPTMSVSAGGNLRQVIKKDNSAKELWDFARTIVINVQMLEATQFKIMTTLDPPNQPRTAAQAEQEALPFFHVAGETPSGIVGAFEGIKSVNTIDLTKEEGDPTIKAIAEAASRSTVHPIVIINKALRPFRHISDLIKEIADFKVEDVKAEEVKIEDVKAEGVKVEDVKTPSTVRG